MGWVKYFLHTPYNQIRADLDEYRLLNAQITRARRTMRAARIGMVADFGKHVQLVPSAQVFAGCEQKRWGPDWDVQTGFDVLREYKCECPYFAQKFWPCHRVNCMYHQFNSKYFENKDIYENLKRDKSVFWTEKFNRIK